MDACTTACLVTSQLHGKIVTRRGHGWKHDVTTGSTLSSPGYEVATCPIQVLDGRILVAADEPHQRLKAVSCDSAVRRPTAVQGYLNHLGEHLLGRVRGPLKFRIVLQPMAAAVVATRAAIRDAQKGHPAYGWAVLTDPARRAGLLREGWSDVVKVFVAAVIVDLIYQVIVLRRIYLEQSIIVAVILALLPYPLVRGLLNRVVRIWNPKGAGSNKTPHGKNPV